MNEAMKKLLLKAESTYQNSQNNYKKNYLVIYSNFWKQDLNQLTSGICTT